jgi:hypothetical protein
VELAIVGIAADFPLGVPRERDLLAAIVGDLVRACDLQRIGSIVDDSDELPLGIGRNLDVVVGPVSVCADEIRDGCL